MWLRCLHQSFWLFSKDAFDHLVSFRPQRYRQNPRGTKRRLRLSFSLNDVNQHNHKHTPRRKNQPDPLTQVSRLPKPSCRCSTQGRQRHNSAAPLSDPAYMRHTDEVSSNCAKIFCASSKLLRYCHISRVRTCASGRGAVPAAPIPAWHVCRLQDSPGTARRRLPTWLTDWKDSAAIRKHGRDFRRPQPLIHGCSV